MAAIPEIVAIAIEQRRGLRFWHNAARMTISPYLYGIGTAGDGILAGVTAEGRCVTFKTTEIVGIELVPHVRHPLCHWSAEVISEPLIAAPKAS